jgi:membrane protease YdiL (CAAX protease family)
MGAIEPKQVLPFLLGWFVLLILSGIGASWIWVAWRLLTGRRLLGDGPLVERRKTPWGSGTVLLIFVLYLVITVLAFEGYIWATGGMASEKPALTPAIAIDKAVGKTDSAAPAKAAESQPEDGGRAENPTPQPETPAQSPQPKAEVKKRSLVELMSVHAVVTAFLLVLLPVVVRETSGAELRDLGLSLNGWRRQVLAGAVAVLFLMPFVYGAQYLAMRSLGFDPEFRHPVEKMLREQFSIEVAVLSILTAVILAPLFEEILFRGIFQSWLVELLDRFWNRVRSRFAERSEPPEFDPFPHESDRLDPSWSGEPFIQWEGEAPFRPTTAEGSGGSSSSRQASLPPERGITSSGTRGGSEPEYWAEDFASENLDIHTSTDEWSTLHREERDLVPVVSKPYTSSPISAGAAIVITSLIFASLHAGQWPAPIPIFILALGLGFIYHRTGSLLAAICMHAVFNGTSTLMLFLGLAAGVPAGNEKKIPPPAVERNAPVEKVKSVAPGVDRRPPGGKK